MGCAGNDEPIVTENDKADGLGVTIDLDAQNTTDKVVVKCTRVEGCDIVVSASVNVTHPHHKSQHELKGKVVASVRVNRVGTSKVLARGVVVVGEPDVVNVPRFAKGDLEIHFDRQASDGVNAATIFLTVDFEGQQNQKPGDMADCPTHYQKWLPGFRGMVSDRVLITRAKLSDESQQEFEKAIAAIPCRPTDQKSHRQWLSIFELVFSRMVRLNRVHTIQREMVEYIARAQPDTSGDEAYKRWARLIKTAAATLGSVFSRFDRDVLLMGKLTKPCAAETSATKAEHHEIKRAIGDHGSAEFLYQEFAPEPCD